MESQTDGRLSLPSQCPSGTQTFQLPAQWTKAYLAHNDGVVANLPQGQQPLGVITASKGASGRSADRVLP